MCGQGLGKTALDGGISRAHNGGDLLSLLSLKGQRRKGKNPESISQWENPIEDQRHRAH